MHEERLVLFERDRLELRFDGLPDSAPISEQQLLEALEGLDSEQIQRLVVAGGSPTEHPQFDQLLRRCQELEVPGLTLETPASALQGRGAQLAEAGFSTVLAFIGGFRSQTQVAVLKDEQPLEQAFLGLAEAVAAGLAVYCVVPCVRANVSDVVALTKWLCERPPAERVRGLLLAYPEIGHVSAPVRRQTLPMGAMAELAGRVFTQAHNARLEYGFHSKRGISACAAPRSFDRFGTVFHERYTFFRHRDEKLSRIRACASCSLESSCAGIEPAYLETYGPAGLSSVPLDVSMDWKLRKLNKLEARDFKHVSSFENSSKTAEQRGLIRINGHCNMSCSFCFVDRTVPDFDTAELKQDIAELRAGGTNHLVLSGGEPTLHPDLAELLDHAKTLEFATIEMQSNGVRAADDSYAEKLVNSGLGKVTFSLHSPNPEVSDRITRLPGAFQKTVASIHNFRARGVETQIAHVITKNNYEELPAMARFLGEEFPREGGELSICFAIAQGISDLTYQWVIPTFSEIKPYFMEALDYCLGAGVGFGGMIGQGGYPPCMLDGELKYYANNFEKVFSSGDHDKQFYKAERCKECSFDKHCIGVRRAYVEAYGDEEIKPFQTDSLPDLPEVPLPLPLPPDPSTLVQLRRKNG